MQELRLAARHTHLYPGLTGAVVGAVPSPSARDGRTCLVEFSDGAAALATLRLDDDTAGVLEAGAYTTAAGTEIPEKHWRIELTREDDGRLGFRIRAKI